jgi:flagellar protein FlgJ
VRRTSPLLVLATLAVTGPLGALLVGNPAAASETVIGTARQWVNVRSGASVASPSVGSLSGGQRVSIICRQAGGTVSGPGGTTDLWDRIGDGRYVSHSYITSMTGVPPRCETLPVAGTAKQWVNVRSGPAVTAPSVGSLSGGQAVTVYCQQSGATGGWNRIGDGRFVMASYLTTATTPPSCDALLAPPSPAPLPVPAPKAGLTAEQTAFLTTVAGPARQSFVEHRVPASVTIAQAILESGWARGDLPRGANNYFGAKCVNGSPGTIAVGCRDYPTRECGASGCYQTTGNFRVYTSVLDSLRDHAVILGKPRYAAAFAYTGEPDRFAAEVHKAGYATDPNYTKLLTDIMAKYDLYRYDVW